MLEAPKRTDANVPTMVDHGAGASVNKRQVSMVLSVLGTTAMAADPAGRPDVARMTALFRLRRSRRQKRTSQFGRELPPSIMRGIEAEAADKAAIRRIKLTAR